MGLLPARTLSTPSTITRLRLRVAPNPTAGPGGAPCRLPRPSSPEPTPGPASTSPRPQEMARDQMLRGAPTQVHSRVPNFSLPVLPRPPSPMTRACLRKPPSKVTEPLPRSTGRRQGGGASEPAQTRPWLLRDRGPLGPTLRGVVCLGGGREPLRLVTGGQGKDALGSFVGQTKSVRLPTLVLRLHLSSLRKSPSGDPLGAGEVNVRRADPRV